jgi:hypothetical protein
MCEIRQTAAAYPYSGGGHVTKNIFKSGENTANTFSKLWAEVINHMEQKNSAPPVELPEKTAPTNPKTER